MDTQNDTQAATVVLLVDALEAISERRILVMDDIGEDASDAMVKVAKHALEQRLNAQATPRV